MSGRSISVLFVCLGNICRSPLARWVFLDVVRRRGLDDRVRIDSCGTGGWHVGDAADPRAAATGRSKGLDTAHTARQLCEKDLFEFDLIVAMDRRNRADILAAGAPAEKVFLMRGFDPASGRRELDVPDPYYGGPEGFEEVYRMWRAAGAGRAGAVSERRGRGAGVTDSRRDGGREVPP
jgi:protein-tyrosine phosphatase